MERIINNKIFLSIVNDSCNNNNIIINNNNNKIKLVKVEEFIRE